MHLDNFHATYRLVWEWNVTTCIREGEGGYFFAAFFVPDFQLLPCLQAQDCDGSNKGSDFKEGQNMQHKNVKKKNIVFSKNAQRCIFAQRDWEKL